MEQKKHKIFVAIPTMGNLGAGLWEVLRLMEARYKDTVEFVYPEFTAFRMFHDFARNELSEEFMKSGADVLWFIDSDVVPMPTSLDIFLEKWNEWECAALPYPVFITKGGTKVVEFTLYDLCEGKYLPAKVPTSGERFYDAAGTGCMLIKRSVLENIPKPYFEFKYDAETRDITEGEDFNFCKKVHEHNFRFFVDCSRPANHYKQVGLLEVSDYALNYAKKEVAAYDQVIRGQVLSLVERTKKSAPSTKGQQSRLILPQGLR